MEKPRSPDEWVQRWAEILWRLWDHHHYMCYMDDIFAQTQAVMNANPAIRTVGGGIFPDWIERSYAWTILAGLRIVVDENGLSLVRLQHEMEDWADAVLTRERFLVLWAHDTARGDLMFNRWAGNGQIIYPAENIRKEREGLISEFKKVERFTNENVAHITKEPRAPAPNYNEIRSALKSSLSLMSRYTYLLIGDQDRSPVPRFSYPWQSVFEFPWVPEGQPIPSYVHLDQFEPRVDAE